MSGQPSEKGELEGVTGGLYRPILGVNGLHPMCKKQDVPDAGSVSSESLSPTSDEVLTLSPSPLSSSESTSTSRRPAKISVLQTMLLSLS